MKRCSILIVGGLILIPNSAAAKEQNDALITPSHIVSAGTGEESNPTFTSYHLIERQLNDMRCNVGATPYRKVILAFRGRNFQCQKKIGKVKSEEEIACLKIVLEMAREVKNFELAQEIQEELKHLQYQNEPVMICPEVQPDSSG